jgi:hypothetical protein
VSHTPEPFIEDEADEEDDQAIDWEPERAQQKKVQQLQKEKDRNQLEAKRKASKS